MAKQCTQKDVAVTKSLPSTSTMPKVSKGAIEKKVKKAKVNQGKRGTDGKDTTQMKTARL